MTLEPSISQSRMRCNGDICRRVVFSPSDAVASPRHSPSKVTMAPLWNIIRPGLRAAMCVALSANQLRVCSDSQCMLLGQPLWRSFVFHQSPKESRSATCDRLHLLQIAEVGLAGGFCEVKCAGSGALARRTDDVWLSLLLVAVRDCPARSDALTVEVARYAATRSYE